jgi:hypothetical protein
MSEPALFAGMNRDEWLAALAHWWRCSIEEAEQRIRSLRD